MYPEEQKLHDVELKVNLLQKDVELNDRLCNKLSESVTKTQELNTNMMQMISLHQQRHELHEKVEEELKEDVKEIHSRITTVNREIHDRIDQVEKHITERIDGLRSDLLKHKVEDKNPIKSAISDLEKWKWAVLGAVLTAGFLLGKIDLVSLLSLIK